MRIEIIRAIVFLHLFVCFGESAGRVSSYQHKVTGSFEAQEFLIETSKDYILTVVVPIY